MKAAFGALAIVLIGISSTAFAQDSADLEGRGVTKDDAIANAKATEAVSKGTVRVEINRCWEDTSYSITSSSRWRCSATFYRKGAHGNPSPTGVSSTARDGKGQTDANMEADLKARRDAPYAAQLAASKVSVEQSVTSGPAPTREAALKKVFKAFEVQKRTIDVENANRVRYGKLVGSGDATCRHSSGTWACAIPYTVERAAGVSNKHGSIAK